MPLRVGCSLLMLVVGMSTIYSLGHESSMNASANGIDTYTKSSTAVIEHNISIRQQYPNMVRHWYRGLWSTTRDPKGPLVFYVINNVILSRFPFLRIIILDAQCCFYDTDALFTDLRIVYICLAAKMAVTCSTYRLICATWTIFGRSIQSWLEGFQTKYRISRDEVISPRTVLIALLFLEVYSSIQMALYIDKSLFGSTIGFTDVRVAVVSLFQGSRQ